MPRIDFFSDAFYPDWTGGLQRYATELAAVAAKQGYECVLWTREWRQDGLADVEAVTGGGVSVRNLFRYIPLRLRGPLISVAAFLGLPLGRPSGEFQVFHTSVLGAAFMRKKSVTPQIYVFHASAGHELIVESASRGKVRFITRVKAAMLLGLERRCLRMADEIIVLSDFSRRLISELHPCINVADVSVIAGGTAIEPVGHSSLTPDMRVGSRRIVVLRRLEWRMGIDLLLKAFAESQAQKEGWRIDIIGTGSQEVFLRALAVDLGLSESVTFHGRVPEVQKLALLDGAAISVLPTRTLEGFGLATVEAMARGVIPIVTTAGASPEVVHDIDARLICEPNLHSIRAAIDHWALERTETERLRLSEVCRAGAQKYGWDPVFASYQAAFSRLSRSMVRNR